MTDPVWPLPSDRVPTFQTYNAIGTMLLHNTRPDSSGRLFATQWLVFVLPMVPLARYYVRKGETEIDGGSETTSIHYEIYGRSRLRAIEIIRTYLYWWAIVPLFIGPIYYAAVQSMGPSDDTPYMFTGMFVSIALLGLYLGALGVYRRFWRPVRDARMVPTKPPRAQR